MLSPRRLFELAVHVKLASEMMIDAARHLEALAPCDASAPAAVAWSRTRNDLRAMNVELGFMARILSAATRERAGAPTTGRPARPPDRLRA
jgi:hypothetical protein